MTTIAERVEAGAKWLDANRPGWVDRINLNTLDLGNPCGCVLGQEFGDYAEAVIKHLDDGFYSTAPAYGFNATAIISPTAWREQIDELTAAWCDYITARRAA